MDYCEEGLNDTLKFLSERGIKYFGCGYKHQNANNPLILDVDGISIGVMGYVCSSTSPVILGSGTPGCALIDLEKVGEDIARARESRVKYIVVQIHWGAQNIYLPKPDDVKIGRNIIELGADIVIGHHSHCIQFFEEYKGGHIFYGLGNCIMPDLDVPAYVSSDGEVSRRYVAKQLKSNRRSLSVILDTSNMSVAVQQLEFRNGELRVISESVLEKRINLCRMPYYKLIFHVFFFCCTVWRMFSRFLANPRWPERRHVKNIFAVLKQREYK
jgi:poly-gamma-glutamate synthesis protein (capsule biosynthesis protein)